MTGRVFGEELDPDGMLYRDNYRSAEATDYYICSGGLIEDSDGSSAVPYFLTANHCLSRGREAKSLETYFNFTESCGASACDFTDRSTDRDGSIVSWYWEFGDGATSTEQHPSHTYPSDFTDWLVTLTVTDDQGATGVVQRLIFVPPLDLGIVLSATTSKVKGENRVQLSWQGGDGLVMEVRRNGGLIYTTDGSVATHEDLLGRKVDPSYTYQVCALPTNLCSNEVTVSF